MSLLRTSRLKYSWDPDIKNMWYVGNWRFWDLFKRWMYQFGLEGTGLMVGHGPDHEPARVDLKNLFPKVKMLFMTDVIDTSSQFYFRWDLMEEFSYSTSFDFIINQSVLEHLMSPFLAMKNLTTVLHRGGLMFVGVPGPESEYHAYPVDCVRFMEDWMPMVANNLHLEIVDSLYHPKSAFYLLRRK